MHWFRKSASENTTPERVQQRLDQGERLLILDVRDPDEHAAGHVPNSQLIPLPQLAQRLDELPRDRPIVTLCRSGGRSSVAAQMLRRAGFEHVENLDGGILAWAKRGLPVK